MDIRCNAVHHVTMKGFLAMIYVFVLNGQQIAESAIYIY